MRNLERGADTGIGGGFVETGMVAGDAHAAVERKVTAGLELIGKVELNDTSVLICSGVCDRRAREARIVDDKAEKIAFVLEERIKSGREVVRTDPGTEVGLRAGV